MNTKQTMNLQQLTHKELLDKIGVMVLVLDDQGRISLVNAAGCNLLGYSADELVGMDWFAHFILPVERQLLQNRFLRIMAGQEELPFNHENTILAKDGAQLVIAWHNTILREDDDTINGLLCTGEDISKKVEAEERIRRSERHNRCFVDHVPDSLFIHDCNGKIIDVNNQACLSLGYSRDELLSLSILDTGLEYLQPDSSHTVKSPASTTFDGMHCRKDGQTFHVEAKVNMLEEEEEQLFVTAVRDISDRLGQKRRLQDKRDLLRVIIDSIPDAICIKDRLGRWLLANSFNLQLFGLEDVNYRGKTDAELAGSAPLWREVFLNCQDSDSLAWQKKELYRHNKIIPVVDGDPRVFDFYKIPLFHPDGRKKALVVIGRDITKQKQIVEKYRKLFEQSPLAYLSSSLSGEILAVNQAVTTLFGYPPEKIVGRNLADFMTPDSCKLFTHHYPQFLKGKPFSGNDYEIFRADGSKARIQVTAAIIYDETDEPVATQSVIVDVTSQRFIEEQVRASEERYRLLFEHAPVGIVHFDAKLQVTDCNENYLQLMRVNRDQLIGFDVNKLQDRRVRSILRETLSGKEGYLEEEYHTTISQVSLFISMRTAPLYDRHGNVQGGMAIVVDVSEQKNSEIEKIRLLSAIDQVSDTIVITDTSKRIKYVNPAFEKMTGYNAKEVQGKKMQILESGHHDAAFFKEMWQTVQAGRVWKGHIINKRKDGTLIEDDSTISPVRNQERKIINYVEVKRDVTQEVSLKRQLNQAMKMEAIGTLAGGIAHDFNNILSAILGYAEMVEMQLEENDPARRDVAQILTAGQRATDLIRQILTFSRQEEEELRPVKLQFIITEALKLLRSSLPTSIELHQEIDPGCSSVLADPVRIHQVLMNLCTNAKQAMAGEQGTLRIRLFEIEGKSPALASRPENKRWINLEVSDTGPGIESEVRERIFDPFFTTKKKEQGTGLGLSVVHGIVKSHGGEITVDSEPGQGTTFHVYLPVVDDEEKCEELAKQTTLPRGNEHILLVDDEPLIVEIIERSLSLLGYKVKSFMDSQLALKWFNRHDGKVDLVITDMTMPQLTGAELAEKILRKWPKMPIILCTGYSEVMDADRAGAMGIRKFLAKPVDTRVLAQSIREALDMP